MVRILFCCIHLMVYMMPHGKHYKKKTKKKKVSGVIFINVV
jgi:hypothetical protein